MIINVYVNLNPSATNRSKIDSENFFLGFYYWDLLSVMLSEVVFNYNFVFFSKIYICLNTRKITGVFNFMHIYFSIQI